ncbi:MAG TPA: helix-turn-helix transcriptional regulator [Micromonosporaceae bacterium]|nr:helix-turn-helix transcriptional regulator [Micromonosporaceae bacterium]
MVAYGLSNDEIAERMVISPLTAKTHINRAMAKLHARDRAQVVVQAYDPACGPTQPLASGATPGAVCGTRARTAERRWR